MTGGGAGACSEEVDELVVVAVEEDLPVPEGAVAAWLLEVAEDEEVFVVADGLLSDLPRFACGAEIKLAALSSLGVDILDI